MLTLDNFRRWLIKTMRLIRLYSGGLKPQLSLWVWAWTQYHPPPHHSLPIYCWHVRRASVDAVQRKWSRRRQKLIATLHGGWDSQKISWTLALCLPITRKIQDWPPNYDIISKLLADSALQEKIYTQHNKKKTWGRLAPQNCLPKLKTEWPANKETIHKNILLNLNHSEFQSNNWL